MMNRFKLSLIFQCLVFLIPLNIYMWGDWILVNVQWALFRFQRAFIQFNESGYVDSYIVGYKDMLYILQGQSTGLYNIAAAVLWTTGVIILLAGLIITIVAFTREESDKLKTASYCTLRMPYPQKNWSRKLLNNTGWFTCALQERIRLFSIRMMRSFI